MTNSDLESLRAIAVSVGEELAARDDVAAVVLVGSVAAGYADEYSDVDLQVVGPGDGGERSVEGVHVEWTPVTTSEIENSLAGWEDDAALFTAVTARKPTGFSRGRKRGSSMQQSTDYSIVDSPTVYKNINKE